MSLLADLNPQQRAAVEHVEGPLLILAGAGSGKTRVITHRIAHLIAHYRIPASSILAMTFTNKAAEEMQSRVASLLSYEAYAQPQLSTFHSFCVRSLRRDYPAIGGKRDFVIYADDEQLRLIKTLVKSLGLDDKSFAPRQVLSRISSAKNRGLSPQQYLAMASDPKHERIAMLYERYQNGLRLANALDFDDLLLETERLLRQSPEVAERYNQRYPYIMIDEYQDTNRPQYELMRLLTSKTQNLCVVGDEDQSIYSWRGADIRNILDFERDYPSTRVIRLEQNYRSTKNILEAASSVVANNVERKGKVLWTQADAGPKVGYYLAPEAEGEALFAAETIRASLAANPGRSIAVLYRTNAQSRLFEEALRRYGLAYRVIGGFSFYERAEVRDILAYLRVAANPADSVGLLRIINTPTRGIGKSTVDTLEHFALEQNLSLLQAIERGLERAAGLTPRALQSLAEFYKLMAEFRTLALVPTPVDEMVKRIIERTGYARMLQAEATPEAEGRLENLNELINAATDAATRGEDIAGFLDHAALISDQDDYDPTAAVQLMSLHAAKGLEFSTVFLAGLEEGLFPHSRTSQSPNELEEERRLCYVGMTRARQQLYLTHAARRRRYAGQASEPSMPSRFLSEVPQALLQDLSPPAVPLGRRYVSEGYNQDERPKPFAASGRPTYNSVESIHQFFQRPGNQRSSAQPAFEPSLQQQRSTAGAKLPLSRTGARVRHAKFGVGTVLRVEGEGDQTKLTISFPGYGLKKLVEKMAGLQPV
ncbi:MAG TPA: UvrD-helicase domain-containing protein [Terriglobales bacterium]|nr:UvrD-helicase domain-containing protein [Terriglobales bacterium]